MNYFTVYFEEGYKILMKASKENVKMFVLFLGLLHTHWNTQQKIKRSNAEDVFSS